MELGLRGRRALVTGASKGIGKAIALTLAGEGAAVATVARDSADLDALRAELDGGDHATAPLDLMGDDLGAAIAGIFDATTRPFDIVVNNVGGTLDVTDPFAPIEDWRAVMRLNFDVAVEINQQFLPHMRSQGWGRIVNVSSVAATELNGPASYAAAKAALTAYTRCVGRLLAGDGVVMTSVLPGVVKTEGGYWEKMETENPEHVSRYLKDRCPLGRFGTVEEIADVVAFLCSDRASFAPGATWTIDGGQLRSYAC